MDNALVVAGEDILSDPRAQEVIYNGGKLLVRFAGVNPLIAGGAVVFAFIAIGGVLYVWKSEREYQRDMARLKKMSSEQERHEHAMAAKKQADQLDAAKTDREMAKRAQNHQFMKENLEQTHRLEKERLDAEMAARRETDKLEAQKHRREMEKHERQVAAMREEHEHQMAARREEHEHLMAARREEHERQMQMTMLNRGAPPQDN